MHELINQLRQAKKAQGLTHAELAHKSGVGFSTIKRWFYKCGHLPKAADLEAVANVLGYRLKLVRVVSKPESE